MTSSTQTTNKTMKLYMYVENDKYELPLVVACSMKELAQAVGCKYDTVKSQLSRQRHGLKVTRFKEVEVELEDGESPEDFICN